MTRWAFGPEGASSVSADDGFTKALERAGGTLAVTTDPGGLFLVGPPSAGRPAEFSLLPLEHAWGLAASPERLAVSTAREIVVFANTPVVAALHPDRSDVHDAAFSPRLSFFTGSCLIHDLAITPAGLLASNTNFSVVSLIDGRFNFDIAWHPPFISAVLPEDRCHLNGIAVADGQLRYVTAFGRFDAPRGWRDQPNDRGVLLDVAADGRPLCEDLMLPHSPRLVGERLFVAEAGRGAVLEIDRTTGARRETARLPGFTRGITAAGGILFVGLSPVRETARFARGSLDIGGELVAGVAALDLSSGALLGLLTFEEAALEVFDLGFLPGIRRPAIGDGRQAGTCYAAESRAGCYWMRVGDDMRKNKA